MKRLNVREAARGAGIGHALAAAAIEQATASGYSDLVLDTLPYITAAQAIYQTFGFSSILPYWDNVVPGSSISASVSNPIEPMHDGPMAPADCGRSPGCRSSYGLVS
jgi:predicted GNAT family N-acyltransferase